MIIITSKGKIKKESDTIFIVIPQLLRGQNPQHTTQFFRLIGEPNNESGER